MRLISILLLAMAPLPALADHVRVLNVKGPLAEQILDILRSGGGTSSSHFAESLKLDEYWVAPGITADALTTDAGTKSFHATLTYDIAESRAERIAQGDIRISGVIGEQLFDLSDKAARALPAADATNNKYILFENGKKRAVKTKTLYCHLNPQDRSDTFCLAYAKGIYTFDEVKPQDSNLGSAVGAP